MISVRYKIRREAQFQSRKCFKLIKVRFPTWMSSVKFGNMKARIVNSFHTPINFAYFTIFTSASIMTISHQILSPSSKFKIILWILRIWLRLKDLKQGRFSVLTLRLWDRGQQTPIGRISRPVLEGENTWISIRFNFSGLLKTTSKSMALEIGLGAPLSTASLKNTILWN